MISNSTMAEAAENAVPAIQGTHIVRRKCSTRYPKWQKKWGVATE